MRVYNEKLAALVGGIVKFDGKGKSWVRTAGNNSYPVLSDLLPQHEQAWLDAMKQYIQDCLAASFADEQ
jgi:hypothetical protein